MNYDELYNLMDQTFIRLKQLSETKGAEYRHSEDDMFANFKRVGGLAGVTPAAALLVFMNKHYDAICTYVRDLQQGRTRAYSEDISGRFDDLLLYTFLLRGMVCPGPAEDESPATGDPMASLRSNAERIDKMAGHTMTGLRAEMERQADAKRPMWEFTNIQHEIAEWAATVFPTRSIESVRLKCITHEIPELLAAMGLRQWVKADEEAVDVIILLLDYLALRQIDAATALRHKLDINRQRQWTTGSDGVSQHVEDTPIKYRDVTGRKDVR